MGMIWTKKPIKSIIKQDSDRFFAFILIKRCSPIYCTERLYGNYLNQLHNMQVYPVLLNYTTDFTEVSHISGCDLGAQSKGNGLNAKCSLSERINHFKAKTKNL